METNPARLHSCTSWRLRKKHWKQLQSQKEHCSICLRSAQSRSWFSIFRGRNTNSISIPSILPCGTARCQVVHSLAGLVEEQLLFSQVSSPFPNGNNPWHGAEGSLAKSTVSCGMLGPVALKFCGGLWQGGEQEDLIRSVERNQANHNISRQVCHQLCTSLKAWTIFHLALQFAAVRCLQPGIASRPS